MSRQAQKSGVAAALVAAVAICAAGATAGRDAAAPAPGYKVVGKIGGEGTGNGQFSGNAYGVATDKAGNVYVADSGNLRIQAFSAKGAYKAKYTFEPGENVIDVAVGPTGDVWGTTDVLTQVRRFTAGGGAPENLTTPKASDGIAVDAENNLYVSTSGDEINAVVRFGKSEAGWGSATTWVGGGLQWPGDVEVSPDGSIYVADKRGSPPSVKRYDASGKLLNTIKTKLPATAGAGAQYGIAVDPDCNLWATDPPQRSVDKFTPSGKLLGTVTSGDLLSTDLAVGPTGDLYVFDIHTRSLVHFAEDRSKPAAAQVPARLTATGKAVKVKYTLTGVACPAQLDATASLTGKGIAGKAAVKVAAGKSTVITIPLTKAASGPAKFTIVLKTNGRLTTQTSAVSLTAR
jgi:hypothetical protein